VRDQPHAGALGRRRPRNHAASPNPADEYDAAQERGARNGDNLPRVSQQNSKPTAADVGLTRKRIHEARAVRDAERRRADFDCGRQDVANGVWGQGRHKAKPQLWNDIVPPPLSANPAQIANTQTAKIAPSTARPLIVHPAALSVSALSTVECHMTASSRDRLWHRSPSAAQKFKSGRSRLVPKAHGPAPGALMTGGTARAAFLAASLWAII